MSILTRTKTSKDAFSGKCTWSIVLCSGTGRSMLGDEGGLTGASKQRDFGIVVDEEGPEASESGVLRAGPDILG